MRPPARGLVSLAARMAERGRMVHAAPGPAGGLPGARERVRTTRGRLRGREEAPVGPGREREGTRPGGAAMREGAGRARPHPPRRDHAMCSLTYSKSPGWLLIPTFGGAIQEAYLPTSYCGFISEAM